MMRAAKLGLIALMLPACPPSRAVGPETKGGDHPLIGKAAPEIVAESVSGDGPKSLAEAKGTVAIVDFWGTYCGPCRESFPKLQGMVDTQAGRLVVIGVSQDDPDEKKAEDLKKFGDDFKVSFGLVWDKEKKTAKLYGLPTMPTSFVVDKKGVVRFVHAGYTAGEDKAITGEVEQLVAE